SLTLKVFGNSPAARIFRSATAVTSCLAYCLMVGSGPSVSRAMIFVALREYGKLSLRSTDLRNLLWSSLVLHICIAPSDFTSIGFQMSYLAVAGIAYLFPVLKRWYPEGGMKHSPLRKIWESAALSISCQATTLPLALLRFGSTSPCFILTNLICLPLTGMAIPLALVLTLLSATGTVWAPAVRVCERLVEMLLFSVRVISGI
ncbi:MAG: ComEC/Rec2 family competence protein, partial [Candidatus Cryptobacteroides sp.]